MWGLWNVGGRSSTHMPAEKGKTRGSWQTSGPWLPITSTVPEVLLFCTHPSFPHGTSAQPDRPGSAEAIGTRAGWTCCRCWCRWRDCSLHWPPPSERSSAGRPQAYTERFCCCDWAHSVTPVKRKSMSETAQRFEKSEGKYCGLLVVERWSRTQFNIPMQNRMWKSVRDWVSVRVCVYTESTHTFMSYSQGWCRISFHANGNVAEGDRCMVLFNGMYCLKALNHIWLFCQNVLTFCCLSNQQCKLLNRIELIYSCPGHCWSGKHTMLSHGIHYFSHAGQDEPIMWLLDLAFDWIILQKLLGQISICMSDTITWN